ncbi:MAG TPA: hypothetical protein VNZ58_03475 [Thermomicrobiales bacterium]|nr:hypothetical protein [Thermomicrobiales bacterium]
MTQQSKVETFVVHDDGTFPGNALPVVLYRQAIAPDRRVDPAQALIDRFEANGWDNAWRNGIFDFRHYHATTHEVLGCARGSVRVELGGPQGRELELHAGDIVVLPAGTAHMNLGHSDHYVIVGAYPPGQSADMRYGKNGERPQADREIGKVPRPRTDPVYGESGPLLDAWSD